MNYTFLLSIGSLEITMNPCDKKKHCQQGTVLTVRARGPGTLSYQWSKDEIPISDGALFKCSGATSDSLHFTSLLPEHSGSYKCKVSSNGHSVESMPAEVKSKISIAMSIIFLLIVSYL